MYFNNEIIKVKILIFVGNNAQKYTHTYVQYFSHNLRLKLIFFLFFNNILFIKQMMFEK